MWNWISRIPLGAGFKSTLSKNGAGLSWGIRGFRIGRSPSGRRWIYIGIPGTGIGFYKRFKKKPDIKNIKWKEI